MSDRLQIFRAAWVVTQAGPPIADGEVVVEDGRIAEVRPATRGTGDVRDLGESVILPGLINAHTHLDYTVMRGILEDIEFFPWIRELTMRKMALDPSDWAASAEWGAAEAVAGGITTIADCTDSGAALGGALSLGLSGVVYQEVFGIDDRLPVEPIVLELEEKVTALRRAAEGTRVRVGISPHAPYTVRPALFTALGEFARGAKLPVCIHAAESRAEAQLLRSGHGPIAEMLAGRGIGFAPPGNSTVAYFSQLGMLGPRTLLVHGVQLSAADLESARASGTSWVHCPKSNAKLGNGVAPLGLMGRGRQPESIRPRLGLGSDSVASNNTMDMFEEMRFAVLMQRGARRRIDALTAPEALEMSTLGGARALGIDRETGSLEPGKYADLCVVGLDTLHSRPCYDPVSALVYAASARDVVLTMAGGAVLYDAGRGGVAASRFTQVDIRRTGERLENAIQKMRDWRAPTV